MKNPSYQNFNTKNFRKISFLNLSIVVQVLILCALLVFVSCKSNLDPNPESDSRETKIQEAKATAKTKATEDRKPKAYKELAIFSGQIVSTDGKSISAAEVDINGKIEKTSPQGYFKMAIKPSNRYVMNIRKKGFGLVSKIYAAGIQEGRWAMTKATTQYFDPRQDIFIRDIRAFNICNGSLSSQVDWSNYPSRHIPHYLDSNGVISDQIPAEVIKAIEFVENADTCNPGISFAIPANSLVDSNGNPPSGNLLSSISTVDIYDSDSMPGDYTAVSDNTIGYMVTYGAGGLNIKDGDKSYQLKKGKYATITVPINALQIKLSEKLKPTIPLLLYNEKTGVWEQIGEASLNSKADAYIAKVTHLSVFNVDIVKTDQACVRLDSSAIDQDYELEVTVPFGGDFIVRTKAIDNTPEKLHVIYNLPSNTNITLRAFRRVGGSIVPITDTVAVNTGNPQNPSTPNQPAYPYGACRADVVLTEASLAPRQLKITNMVGSQRLNQVVQVKIIPFGSTYTSADLLTADSPTCWALPGEYIASGQSRTFDVTIGEDYLVFIGMGIWETDLVTGTCNTASPWVKIRFFTDFNWNIWYPWIEVEVNDHIGGPWEWTITGAYTAGNLLLNPANNPSIPFQITSYNPIP